MMKLRKRVLTTTRMKDCIPSKEEAKGMNFEQYVRYFDSFNRLKSVTYYFGEKK